jgi:NAD(P)-dependent dehydrogenase (short-subunit alcohol dehydrogenase family)
MSRKCIVITGCSSGFGYVTAFEMARLGWLVIATVRKTVDQESLLAEARKQQCENNIRPLLCDILHEDQVALLKQQVDEILSIEQNTTTPRLDALLNNAGNGNGGGPIELLSLDNIRNQMEVNFIAHIGVIQTFLPLLKNARGTIINVSSISGRISTAVTGIYAASKFALEAMSDALRVELAPFGVRVVLIEPSSSPTNIWETSIRHSIGPLSQRYSSSSYDNLLRVAEKVAKRSSKHGFPPELFAKKVVHILYSKHPKARYPVPFQAALIIFAHRFLPDSVWDRLQRLMLHW